MATIQKQAYRNEAEKLAALFEKFPGIGPRQARRFVYHILKSPEQYTGSLINAIREVKTSVHQCQSCLRFFAGNNMQICGICANDNRDTSRLLIVAKDADLDQIEKSGAYNGRYFVIGSTTRLTDSNIPNINTLTQLIKKDGDILEEIILALPATTEGDHTTALLYDTLSKITDTKITELGRGLSTGTELEYSDTSTLKSAIESRRSL